MHSFENIVDEHGSSVYRFCRSLTYSKQDADDLFQETFLKVLEQFHNIRTTDNFKSFIFSTCSYLWKSQKRKYARRNRIAPSDVLDETVADNHALEDGVIAAEENAIVRALVNKLPEKLKIPINLYYSAEMSVPEIASSLKIPVGTVKSRLFNARKIIEKGLMEYEA